ncbi:MAG: YidC/Oxa1 family membrane protein insertase [Clostridia bacterium]|nr:YidC/Oxa1 family membrane protein insertase [Clostridia bacterium]
MKWVYENIAGSNFLLTIVLCTLLLRAVTVFGDISSRKSSQKMSLVQPKIQKLQQKYANDPQKLRVEQSKLMKQEGVSMWGGCLPMLITMPLFLCFFAAFRYWASENMLELLLLANTDIEAAKELFSSYQFLWVCNIWQADSPLLPVIAEPAAFLGTQDLSRLLFFVQNPESMSVFEQLGMAVQSSSVVNGEVVNTWNFIASDTAIAEYTRLTQSLVDMYPGYTNGWFLFPVLTGGLMFLSSLLSQQKPAKGAQISEQEQQSQKSMKMMTYIFPVVCFVACLTSTTAFAIYWGFSSVLMIVINLVLNRLIPRTLPPAEPTSEEDFAAKIGRR